MAQTNEAATLSRVKIKKIKYFEEIVMPYKQLCNYKIRWATLRF